MKTQLRSIPGTTPSTRALALAPAAPTQRQVRNAVTRPVRARLDAFELPAGNRPAIGRSTPNALPSSTLARLAQSAAAHPQASLQNSALDQLSQSPGFQQLSASQQQAAIRVFERCDLTGEMRLIALCDRTVNGRTALLDRDAEGTSLIDRLDALARAPLQSDVSKGGFSHEQLLATLLQECATPGQINQSNRNTCTVTSMQYLLCEQNPAEYVRLMDGLLTGDGKVKMRGGQTLTLEKDSIPGDSAWDRSPTERIFQSAMMEYANGSESYSNVDDQSERTILWLFHTHHTGLYASQQERGMEALFGRNFRRTDDDIVDLAAARAPRPTYVRMHWGEGKKEGHAVTVTRVQNGRVYFRNPWGATSDPVGTQYDGPPRRLENSALREESMTVAEFERWCEGAIV